MKQNEINSWGVVQMYKPYRCKEGIYSYIPAKSFKPSRKIEENMLFSYSLFLSNIPYYDGKRNIPPEQIKLFLSVTGKKCILHWKNI